MIDYKVRMKMLEDHQSPSTQAKDEESGRCEQNRPHPRQTRPASILHSTNVKDIVTIVIEEPQKDWNEEEEGWMDEDSEEAILLASRVSGDGRRALIVLISILDRNVYAGDNIASVSLGKEDNRHPKERH
ncbi:hypothetical protein CPC08DRAFT_717762 [Agrocybe pediades]|nr:hypothetical protein CPC08DRAFT_717762 [Agrocybe pediades]